MKTIKEIADELGVSKEAVRKQVAKLPPTVVTIGANRTIRINAHGEALLKKMVRNQGAKLPPTEPPTETVTEAVVKLLQKELEAKNEQIRELNARLAESNAALGTALQDALQTAQAAQALHAGTIHQQLAEGDTEPAAPVQVRIKNQGIFARLFKMG